ncbi:hypothetical protein B9Z19DRAFT_1118642 [Tuber borchii]|uniref:Uncharacterized protein n=1 Tax=Tuber borchii TaxID=42251 RepID=A0A2T7A858_TUBBO|nr:hypothetical protein B9Z19DRAFT_1118642 [Tuber borchii]
MNPPTNPFTTLLSPLTKATSTSPYTPLVSTGDIITMSIIGIFPHGVQGAYSPTNISTSTSTAAEVNLYIPNNSLYSTGLMLSQDGRRYVNANGDKVLSVGGEVEVKVLLIRKGGEVGVFHVVCGAVSTAGGRAGTLKREVRMEMGGDGDWELGMVGL